MYNKNELEAELIRVGITRAQLANELSINKSTVSKKMCGKSDWTLPEIEVIMRHIGANNAFRIFFAQIVE